MEIVRTQAELRHRRGARVLVPTMGALHAGHAELIGRAAALARERGFEGVAVSVFVNPSQFNEASDFDRYPRTLDADCAIAESAGASVVFAPSVSEVYPRGTGEGIPPLPACATEPGLEDAVRPGHFAGVCQVVKRLFEMAEPKAAVFGEKDWQQLCVVREMTASLGLGVEIVGVPTVREPDGLALSSRNVFLSAEDRRRSPAIFRALRESNRASTPGEAEAVMRRALSDASIVPEYAVVRDAASLGAPAPGRECRALIAARAGSVRLIDNARWRASVTAAG